MSAEVFTEFALLLLISAVVGMVANWIRQPVLIAYIVVGILVGPAVLGIVNHQDQINLLAQIGVAVLLFVVGLKLDLHHVRQIGGVALATGLGQLTFTIVFGFVLVLLLGKSLMDALYVSVALTFSSTIIIVKLLSDKRELDTLHGRIAVGFLIVQDLAVVVAMMMMSALRADADADLLTVSTALLLRVVVTALALYILMRHVLPHLVRLMARSQDLLLIFAIAWGTGGAALGEHIGFSKEAGAFLAGFSLASTPYREAIGARLIGIRDFLLLFFFIELGSKLDFAALGGELLPATVLSVFVLIGNPLIVLAIMGYMGYRKRTGFLAGLTVAQISEFSIVFVAMGVSLGHVGLDVLSLTTLIGIVTIAISSYMIIYSQALYVRVAPWLSAFERKIPHRESDATAAESPDAHPDVIVFGLGRYGLQLAKGLGAAGQQVIGVDFNPDLTEQCRDINLTARFGDGMDSAFLESLPLRHVRWAVSTLPDVASHRELLRGLREHDFKGSIVVIARDESDKQQLEQLGITQVLYPLNDAVEYAIGQLSARIAASKGE